MTKTYYDIDAVTRLLEEKERDLELAAKIGQSLLETNQQLQARVETLEQDIRNANESVAQLTHEVHLKNEMLKVYLREEEAECERRCAEEEALAASRNRQGDTEYRFKPERRRADRFDTMHSSMGEAANDQDSNANDISVSSARDSNDGPSVDTSPLRSRSHQEPVVYTNERQSYSHPQDVNSEMVSALNRTLDELQRRIACLEQENNALREQHRELRRDEYELEETEHTLVNEVIRQLGDANNQIVSLSEDVTRKTDLCVKQQEDNSSLLASNIDLETRVRRVVMDNEELERRLREAQAVQHELTDELGDLRSRVAELSAQLNDAQDEVRTLRRRRGGHSSRAAASSTVGAAMTQSHYSMTSSLNESSLAAEISDSLRQHPSDARNMSFEIGISAPQPSAVMCNTLNTLHTVRTANAARGCATGSTSGHESMDEQTQPRFTVAAGSANSGLPHDADTQFEPTYLFCYACQTVHRVAVQTDADADSTPLSCSAFASPRHSNRPSTCPYAAAAASTPRMQSASVPMSMTPTPTHIPLAQRSTRSHAGSSCSSQSMSPGDSILALEMTNSSMFSSLISHQTRKTNSGTSTQLASPLDTSQERTLSRMSGISGQTGNSAYMRNCYPKLQIVKPLAGSLTLSWWQQLATPNLGTVLQSKTGIQTRSESRTAFDEDKLTLSDVDEDDERERIEAHRLSWKSANNSSSNTYSTSRILHPTDNNIYSRSTLGQSSQTSPRISMASASLSTKTSTVYSMGSSSTLRSNSTCMSMSRSTGVPRQPASTFSVSMGLAEVLKERGVGAAESQLASSQPSVADELESVRSDGEQALSLSLSPSKSQSQAKRLPTLSVPSVMNASQSVTERVFAPPPVTSSAQQPLSDAARRLDSKSEHAAAMQVNKVDYFGIFKMVKTVTSRVFAPGAGSTAECEPSVDADADGAESAQANDQDAADVDDTTRPLWRPDPGTLSEKTLRYVSSSPNLQHLVTPSRLSSASSSRSVATVTTSSTNSTRSHLVSEGLSGSPSGSSTPKTPTAGRRTLIRGLNLLAQPSDGAKTVTGVLGLGGTASPRIVTRAASSATADQCKSSIDMQ